MLRAPWLWVVMLGLGLSAGLVGCGKAPPAQAGIQAQIERMQDALEDNQPRAFLAVLADDFSAPVAGLHEGMDQRAAGLMLRRELQARQRVKARIMGLAVTEHGPERAEAEFNLLLTGGSGLLSQSAGWYSVTTGWRLEDKEWKMISARWEQRAGL